MSDKFIENMERMVSSEIAEINTCKPGKIVSYDADSNRAVCKPDMPISLLNSESVAAPQIVEVPVLFYAAQIAGVKAGISFPLMPGDGVLLFFSDRSLENWLSGSNDQPPDDPRKFDLSDAFAMPALNSAGFSGDARNVRIFFGEAEFLITPVGKMIFNAPGGIEFNTPNAEFSQKLTTPLAEVAGVEQATHVHGGVQSGASRTGPHQNG